MIQPAQVKQNLNAATNSIARLLIESKVASDRDEARVILAKVLEDKDVRFSITKAAYKAR